MTTISDLNPAGALLTGSLCSFTTIACGQPFYTLKTLLMTGQKPPSALSIHRSIRFYYRGVIPNMLCDQANQPVAFTVNNIYHRFFLGDKTATPTEKIMGGCLSGLAAAPANSALERLMIIQQVHTDPTTNRSFSLWVTVQKIYRTEGWRGAFKGVPFTAGREMCNASFLFGFQPIIADKLNQTAISDKKIANQIAFIVAGALTGAATAPFDLAKTIVQSELGTLVGSSVKHVFKVVKQSYGDQLYRNLARSAAARMMTMSYGLGMIGFTSSIIPGLLPDSFQKAHL